MKVLITGAAGNLGSLLAKHLLRSTNLQLNLLMHRKPIPPELSSDPRVSVFKTDLASRETLGPGLEQVDVVIHFAGVLFRSRPEKFLSRTNTKYFCHLVDKAVEKKVKRIILISFPHVEGETTMENPARGSLEGQPSSVHAQTRLEEERYLFKMGHLHGFEALVLRVGMIYGRDILMIEAARWLAAHRLLGVWEKPTWIHLISKKDFLAATTRAIVKDNLRGIYHLGDEGRQTLQQFLDDITVYWGYPKPWRMPLIFIDTITALCELFSFIFNTPSPLTRDFIKIGRISYYGDTTSMRRDLLPELKYKTYQDGMVTM